MPYRSVLAGVAGFLGAVVALSVQANVIQGWETPGLRSGTTSTILPSPWVNFTTNGPAEVVNSVSPLPSPAGGNQYLLLGGTNTGVDLVTNITITPSQPPSATLIPPMETPG